jgi:hypothetical protein
MKKSKLFLRGIFGILLVFGLVLTGCGGDDSTPPAPPEVPDSVGSAAEAKGYFYDLWGTLSSDQKDDFIDIINGWYLPEGIGSIDSLDDLPADYWEDVADNWDEITEDLQDFVEAVNEQNNTPSSGPGITITGIASQYNGQYASFRSSSNTRPKGGDFLVGGTGISDSGTITGIQIKGGSVTIPINLIDAGNESSVPYEGTDKGIRIYVIIKASSSFNLEEEVFSRGENEAYTIDSVDFTKGNASVNVGGGNIAKTLAITNISNAQLSQGESGIKIGIFPQGTTTQQADKWEGIVAGAQGTDGTLAGNTLTVPLYSAPFESGSKWTGTGTYDVYLTLLGNEGTSYYQKKNVPFTEALTSVSAATFSSVTP